MSKINQLLKKYPSSDFYRFIVDGVYHSSEQGWLEYALREPGCINGVFDAFGYAISTNMDDRNISPELLKEIQRRVSTPIRFEEYKTFNPMNPGNFRSNTVNFELIPEDQSEAYCNLGGLEELVNFVKVHKSEGSALFRPKRTIQDLQHERELGVYETLTALKEAYTVLHDEIRDAPDESAEITYEGLLSGERWHFRAPHDSHLPSLIDTLCAQYNAAISKAVTIEEKLRIIVLHVQAIERTHPFCDGNGRTSYILLQRLLIQNGFLPTIMANPNHLDGFDLDAVIHEIKEGMKHTNELIQNPKASIFGYCTKQISINDIIPAFPYVSPELFEEYKPKLIVAKEYYEAREKLSEIIQALPEDNPENLISQSDMSSQDVISISLSQFSIFYKEKAAKFPPQDDLAVTQKNI